MKKAHLLMLPFMLLVYTATAQEGDRIVNDTTIYMMLSTPPVFGATDSSLKDFVRRESRFPVSWNKTAATKNVFVRVIIDETGKATFDRVMKSPDERLSLEAKRIVETMPAWSPGKLADGRPARIYYNLPFWFE